jgi:UTP--glucose-1-phosphate uridylyltransferase
MISALRGRCPGPLDERGTHAVHRPPRHNGAEPNYTIRPSELLEGAGGKRIDDVVEPLDGGEQLTGHLCTSVGVELLARLGEKLGMTHRHRQRRAQIVDDHPGEAARVAEVPGTLGHAAKCRIRPGSAHGPSIHHRRLLGRRLRLVATGARSGRLRSNGTSGDNAPPMDLRHCVIPAAGLGTRFLPATKALPKELLPILDRPILQWGVEEAVAAGCDTMVVVTSRGKELIAAHFDSSPELERVLEARGRHTDLAMLRSLARLASFAYVYQPEPLGLGHAVLCASPLVGDRPFACLLPDDLSYGGPPVLAQLVAAYRELATPVLALRRVPREGISRYGVATVAESRGRLHRITSVVEKPPAEEAASDLAIMGRYVLTPAVVAALARTQPGAGGEIQLTDGIAGVLSDGEVWGLEFEGELLDAGTPEGWLQTLIRTARDHPVFGPAIRDALAAVQT